MEEDKLISEKDVAEMLGYSLGTVRNLRYSGKGPDYVQPAGKGGKVSYWMSDVKAWLNSDSHSNEGEVAGE